MIGLLLFLSLASAQDAPPSLSLHDAMVAAVANNPEHHRAELSETIAAIDARRARLDRFSATVSSQANGDVGVVKPAGEDAVRGSDAAWDARATVGVPLYAGGAYRAAIDYADQGAQIAALETELTDRELVRAAYTAYWTIKGYELQIAAAEEGLDLTQQALDIIVAKADAGLAAGIDVNRSRVDLLSQQDSLVQAKAALYSAQQELLRLLHLPGDAVVLTDEPPAPTTGPVALPADAGAARPELEELALQKAQSEATIIQTRSAALPYVGLTATAGMGASAAGTPDVPFTAEDLRPDLDASVGVVLSWDPFDLLRVRDSVSQARLSAALIDDAEDATRASIAAEIRQAASNLDQLRQRAPLVDAQVALARDNLKIVQGLYAQGSTTLLELFNAQSAFRSALTQGATLRVELATAEYDLRWLLGEDLTSAGVRP